MRTLVVNGTVVTATTTQQADIQIEGESVAAIGQDLQRQDGDRIIDATDCYVMPGGVDVHTHLNLSIGPEKVSDGFYHGSVAAAHGGTTCIVEHPGFGPKDCSLAYQLELYSNEARGEMLVDYAFHGVVQNVTTQIMHSIEEQIAAGIVSFKAYLTYSERLSDGEIVEFLQACQAAGGLCCFHAEDHEIISSLSRELRAHGDISDPRIHPRSRPAHAEADAISRLITIARAAGNVPLYIVHLSTAAGLAAIQEGREQGLQIYAETCPQYLCLTDARYAEPDNRGLCYIMAPPLRKQEDCEALWQGLADGSIDVLATDHCSFSFARKYALGANDIFAAPGGIPGVETRIPLLFSLGVLKKRISLSRFVELTATNPARIMGLAPAKGDIAVGCDADILILDPAQEKRVEPETLHQHVDYTPFAGMQLRGWPRTVLLRGELLLEDGHLRGNRGRGKFIKRRFSDRP